MAGLDGDVGLLAVTMPMSIVAITLITSWIMGLPWTVALLLGASLAPTDPVLASDIQVGPPNSDDEDEVRFGLASEAGFNNGLTSPFMHMMIALAVAIVILLVIRRIAGSTGLLGHKADRSARLTHAFFRHPRCRLDLLSRLRPEPHRC